MSTTLRTKSHAERGPIRATTSPTPSVDLTEKLASASMSASQAIPLMLEKHGGMLHAVALRLCGNKADAEDVVQEVFLQAFRKWHTFEGRSDVGSWLYTIAARSCKARTRRKGGIDTRMPAVSQLMPWNETTVMEIATLPEGDESEAERGEAVARVQGEITRLPEHLRLPLVLKEVMGMSVEDTASALYLATNTVKTRLHRARLALRKAMMAKGKAVEAPLPIYEKQVCLDLLKAKMEAMDRGDTGGGKIPQAEVCARCKAVFKELDLVHDACARLAEGHLPEKVRSAVMRALSSRDKDSRMKTSPARGRRPVSISKRLAKERGKGV